MSPIPSATNHGSSNRSESLTRAAKRKLSESGTSKSTGPDHMDTEYTPLQSTSGNSQQVVAKSSAPSNQVAIATLENAIATVQSGVNFMQEVISEYKKLYDEAPVEEKKKAFKALINSTMYSNFSKATADSAEALSYCAKIMSENIIASQPVQETETDDSSPTCAFEVRMVPIEGKVPEGIKVIDVFLAATDKIRLNVTSSDDRGGTGYIRVTKMEHAKNAVAAISKFVHNGLKVNELYQITASAISSNTIRTVKAKLDALLNIGWIKEDESVDIDTARNVMMMKNCDWCHKPTDIEHIQLNSLPQSYIVIQLFLSAAAFDRIVVKGRNSIRINVGNGITMQSYINISPVICYKCLAFGHVMSGCKKAPRCKHCGESHASATCTSAKNPTCFRCQHTNTSRTPEDQVCENHHALHRDCPEMEHQGDLALISRQQLAIRRLNVARN